MNSVELSELIEEIREIELYGHNPADWMGYLMDDNSCVSDQELAHRLF